MRRRKFLSLLGAAGLAALGWKFWRRRKMSAVFYIADQFHCVVRKVDGSGIITTFAGTPTVAGYSGDGGAATSAQLDRPCRIALDSAGNVYIADDHAAVIRKVDIGTGNISTYAGTGTAGYTGDGGLATIATLSGHGGFGSGPWGVAFDSSDNLFIADLGNAVIRKVAKATGIITTYAGSGSPGYSGDGGLATVADMQPRGLAFDASGNLYLADDSNAVVRKIDHATGIITTVAGTGTGGYTGDGGAATIAELNAPTDVAFDSSGNLFIADCFNYVVRKVSGGIISTLAASVSSQRSGISTDASGNVYTTDDSAWIVNKITSGGAVTVVAGSVNVDGALGDGGPATSAIINAPVGVAIAASVASAEEPQIFITT